MKYTAEEVQNATEKLRQFAPKGARVWTVVRNVSRSGMFRRVSLLVAVEGTRNGVTGPEVVCLDWWVQTLRGEKHDCDKAGVGIPGCGMDMGFALVYDLAAALYGDGYALEQSWL